MMEQGNGRMAGQRRPDPRKDRKMLGEKSEEEGLFTPVILVMQKGRRRRGGERRSWRSCFFFFPGRQMECKEALFRPRRGMR